MWKFVVGASASSFLSVILFGSITNAQVIYEALPARYEILPGYNPRLTIEQAARLASVSEQPCVVIVNGSDVGLAPAAPPLLLSDSPYRKIDGLYVRRVHEHPLYFHKRDFLPLPPPPRIDRGDEVNEEAGEADGDARDDAAPLEPRVPARIGPAVRPADGKMQAGEIRIFPSKSAATAPRASDKSDQVTP